MVVYNMFRDVPKKKNKPSKFDILIVNENLAFKFDYFAGKRSIVQKIGVILKVRNAIS